MKEKRILYFALGVLSVVSIGAVTNQVAPASSTGLTFSDTGITFPDGTVQTTAASADPRRVFYLTNFGYTGAQALGACAPGFHMASIWEILDPSNLRYATDAEGANNVHRRADSGVGPPSNATGWVRTGYLSFTGPSEGSGNCSAWTSSKNETSGTKVFLNPIWNAATGTGDPSQIVAPWDSGIDNCEEIFRVWCFQD